MHCWPKQPDVNGNIEKVSGAMEQALGPQKITLPMASPTTAASPWCWFQPITAECFVHLASAEVPRRLKVCLSDSPQLVSPNVHSVQATTCAGGRVLEVRSAFHRRPRPRVELSVLTPACNAWPKKISSTTVSISKVAKTISFRR